ncbi:hypothetical protein [Aliikangiella coralliicola]|uniref:Uncharacterized protein n=1 Tax=Aliikangiella coralliicola TaxID=2592383 RepID=A0A545UCH2_9GAMM|nr:hypothetical protein [Aliikangiella coralliicola]TQV87165.1 hypothetical protein FLL46_15285 [Aliikangiella coralliicola]
MKKKTIYTLAIITSAILIISFSMPVETAIRQLGNILISLLNPVEKIPASQIEFLREILNLYLPWLIFAGVVFLFSKLLRRARKRKAGIVILASLIQMFLPDPFVERTIKMEHIQTRKSEEKDEGEQEKNNLSK